KTMGEINKISTDEKLELKAVSWQEAAGFLGQLIWMMKAALYVAAAIIFLVTMVIINNAVMMATMQRTQTIGTMRAIGAQRGFVLNMVLFETLVLGLVFGGIGALLGSSLMALLHRVGIPATTDELYFFFSGPRLFPTVGFGNVAAAFIVIIAVSLISTFYPA